MICIILSISTYSVILGPIKLICLGIALFAGTYVIQIVYAMRDNRRVRHKSTVYYRGEGQTICVAYSEYVIGNIDLEVYADNCQLASLYRGTETMITVPSDGQTLLFYMHDGEPVGKFDVIDELPNRFYCYSNNKSPIKHYIVPLDNNFEVDYASEKVSYADLCYEFKIMEIQTLVFGIVCTFVPLAFNLFL